VLLQQERKVRSKVESERAKKREAAAKQREDKQRLQKQNLQRYEITFFREHYGVGFRA